ncbi:hypothetical protein CEXT_719681 [Caerostris extrusa]|uniref:Uncharacterized protein n=1 Tax=Caerostris extrusa TaxID=172846 RepID=A0AAV4VZV6_CAEEX|nr:hypothetical protein CEXT_719681 [Caerostris extrusa]
MRPLMEHVAVFCDDTEIPQKVPHSIAHWLTYPPEMSVKISMEESLEAIMGRCRADSIEVPRLKVGRLRYSESILSRLHQQLRIFPDGR